MSQCLDCYRHDPRGAYLLGELPGHLVVRLALGRESSEYDSVVIPVSDDILEPVGETTDKTSQSR